MALRRPEERRRNASARLDFTCSQDQRPSSPASSRAVLAAASLAVAPAVQVVGAAAPPTGCQLQSAKGAIKHVIYVQFDNVHFTRDNPNVPSDVEQMPNLLNFIKDNGTLLTNDHTILISHTGGGILSSLTGLYPDRHGQAVSNSYNYFRANGTSGFSSDVQVLDGYHRRRQPGQQPADRLGRQQLQHGERRPGLARRHRRDPQRARAVGPVHAGRL